jgi:hypothetical protein
MGKYKGSNFILIKKMLEAKAPEAKQAFLASLTPEERERFDAIIPTTWVPIEQAEVFLEKLAAVIYPNDPDCYFKLGEIRAQDTLKGIYKVMFRILTAEAIIDNSYRLWPMLHDKGQASVLRTPGIKQATFIVNGYPELPRSFRLMMAGFISGCMKLCNTQVLSMQIIETDPNNWKWQGTWK